MTTLISDQSVSTCKLCVSILYLCHEINDRF